VSIKCLGTSAKLFGQPVEKVEMLSSAEPLQWQQTADALVIAQPKTKPNDFAIVFKITPK
jgi:hypothetical protein